ncbi:MAG: hypothetical protein K0U68_16035 [Gammaproteobacteria bacterium]|nr:hypothetical protein [Gammaproteobacteria bacterium]
MRIKYLELCISISLVACTSDNKTVQDDFQHFDSPNTPYQGSSFTEVWDIVSIGEYKTMPEKIVVTPESLKRRKLLTDLTNKNAFLRASSRTLDTPHDYATNDWDRYVHPNGICVAGKWVINQQTSISGDYSRSLSGYFAKGSTGLIIARISTEGASVSNRETKSLSLVGKIYPTLDKNETVKTANFITQDDLGGRSPSDGIDGVLTIADVTMRNAPDVSVSKRIESGGTAGFLSFIATKKVFEQVDLETTIRQLYQISEAGLKPDTKGTAPIFMEIRYSGQRPDFANDPKLDDFRDWIKHHIQNYKPLVFDIAVSNKGTIKKPAKSEDTKTSSFGNEKQRIKAVAVQGLEWSSPIGRMVFDQVIASSGCDHRIHFQHPPWRDDLNDSITATQRDSESMLLIK